MDQILDFVNGQKAPVMQKVFKKMVSGAGSPFAKLGQLGQLGHETTLNPMKTPSTP